uniref:Neuroplastin n=1 Tax=Phallusia mammillata TaxID=59560 RepID=A0A6F9DML7_9ASCI|nr:neuroplastin [Phallusia mammillata]
MKLFVLTALIFGITDAVNVNITAAKGGSGVTLNCTGTASNYFQWSYTPPNGDSSQVQNATTSDYIITNSRKVGQYVCAQAGATLVTYNAMNLTVPVIQHKGHSITLYKNDKNRTLVCTSYSYPAANFTWRIVSGNVETMLETNTNYLINSDGNGKSVLTILTVKDTTRGDYVCRVTNTLGTESSSKVLVRVHSTMAWMWPLIGIVAEIVVILCIILVVRRQTIAQQKEAACKVPSATGAQPNSADHPDLRNRAAVRT